MGGSWFSGQVRGKHFYAGDLVDVSQTCSPITLLDFLKGILHLVNGKLEYDPVERIVWLHPPDDVDVPTTLGLVRVPGFYKPHTYQDLSPVMLPESLKIGGESAALNRYVRLSFQNTSDPSVPEEDRETLHSIRLDYGTGLGNDEEQALQNPLFEPTIDVFLPVTITPEQDGLRVPSLRDTEEEKLSEEIGPRVAWSQGFVAQTKKSLPFYHTNDASFDVQAFHFEQYDPDADFNATMTVYLSQNPQARLWPIGSHGIGTMAYGQRGHDLYQMFWQRELAERWPAFSAEVLLSWNRAQALTSSFRMQALLLNKGLPMLFRPYSVNDIELSKDLPVLVKMSRGGCLPTYVPCGCATKSCLWFQGFKDGGPWDPEEVMLVSFEVDGQQYVEDPLPLGPANVITLSGLSYVTNMVDVLNLVGVPYFTFTYEVGGGALPAGDRPLFFRMKHPTCQKFTILFYHGLVDSVNLWLYTEEGLWQWDIETLYWTQDPAVLTPNYPVPTNCTSVSAALPCDVC